MARTVDRSLIQLLTERKDGLAYDAVQRQYARYAEQWDGYGVLGRQKSVRDMGYHLDYLVEALALADPSLFGEYIAWLKVLFANLGFSDTAVSDTLNSLREALLGAFPEALIAPALVYVDVGRQVAHAAPTTLPTLLVPEAPHAALAQSYLHFLLEGERQQASTLILNALQQGHPIRELYIYVFQVAQREIGRLWQLNQISVAQEHYCTAATQMIMSQLYSYIFATARNGKRFIGACVQGELHELGLRMVADFFEMAGWDTYYIGANTPPEAVIRTVKERKVDIVGISITMTFHVRKAFELIAQLRAAGDGTPKILVGGYPFNLAPDLWREVGADACAHDAQGAVDLANQLIS